MMDERGLKIAHTTILRWVFKFSFELQSRVKPYLNNHNKSWRLDETYIKVNSDWKYLFRAVAKTGNTIDFYLSHKRDYKAALRFFRKIIHRYSQHYPNVINVDKNGAYTMAKRQLEKEKKWPPHLMLRQNKYLNNIIKQDHRRVKWKMNHAMGYHTMQHAWSTTTGVEVMHMLKKDKFLGVLAQKMRNHAATLSINYLALRHLFLPLILIENRPVNHGLIAYL